MNDCTNKPREPQVSDIAWLCELSYKFEDLAKDTLYRNQIFFVDLLKETLKNSSNKYAKTIEKAKYVSLRLHTSVGSPWLEYSWYVDSYWCLSGEYKVIVDAHLSADCQHIVYWHIRND